jgi:hypothetical protein
MSFVGTTPFGSSVAVGQMQLEWEHWDRPDMIPNGEQFANGVWSSFTSGTNSPMTSGKDWYYSMVKVYEPPQTLGDPLGAHIGYVFAGYMGWSNWRGPLNGCTSQANNSNFPNYPGTTTTGTGNLRMAVVRYRLDGTIFWMKGYHEGSLNGVIQDSNGDIVVCGIGLSDAHDVFSDIGSVHPLYVNPQSGETLRTFTDQNPLSCPSGNSQQRGVMFAMKVDHLDGNVKWNTYMSPDHMLTGNDDLTEARNRSFAHDLVETKRVVNGQPVIGYRVVGYARTLERLGQNGGTFLSRWERPFMVQLDEDGYLTWRKLVDDQDLAPLLNPTTGEQTAKFQAIDKVVDGNGDELFVLSGTRGAVVPSVFAQYWKETSQDNDWVPPGVGGNGWTRDMGNQPGEFPGHSPGSGKFVSDILFHSDDGPYSVILPVMDNLRGGFVADGLLYKLALLDGTVQEAADIGELHAFDLRVGLTAMNNGNIGLCCTKWPAGKSWESDRYGWNDLIEDARTCFSGLAVQNGLPADQFETWDLQNPEILSFYGSQSYVAELSGTDLSLIWEKQWQHKLDPAGGDDCYPGNVRRRQCNFKLVESPDGGLVVCGNTGHNFDDAYIAKLAPCEDVFAYTTELPLDANGEHHITTNTEWTEDLNIQGSIVVDPGKTLTVNTATIGFAASTPSLKSNIVVQPGGTLIVKNNGHLTSAPECTGQGMWDGVKVLGNGTTVGAGTAIVQSGGRVSNALSAFRCSEGHPTDPLQGNTMSGGIVQATDAIFENNFFDVVTRPHADIDPVIWGPSSFTNSRFIRTKPLNDPNLAPGVRLSLMASANTEFLGCSFVNSSTVANPRFRGGAMHSINTAVRVDQMPNTTDRTQFKGFSMAVLHSAYEPTKAAHFNACDFKENLRGAFIAGTPNAIVTNNTFAVTDEALTELGIEGTYGAYLHGCTGFEFEENTFTASGTDHPKVGAIFKNTGLEDNFFYNNTFNGFADLSERSVGSLVMGTNAGVDGTGLRIKCNDYSATSTNDHDVAFTGSTVLIATDQGSGVNEETPAGNTFANVDPLTCNDNDEQHLFVQYPVDGVNVFQYWHHQPQQSVELVPHCASAPINPDTWYFNSFWQYSKPAACPFDVSGFTDIADDETVAGIADDQYDVLKDVYTNWKDGGDTEGLVDYVKDPAHTSYEVRNQLMLVAPKASKEAWVEAFAREPAMNSWHLAQALLANSPLEPAVMNMMKDSHLTPFYKDLVKNGQNGGISMHSIYKSEIAHFYGQKATALQAMLRKSMTSTDPTARALTKQALDDYPTTGADAAKLALYYMANDLSPARSLVDAHLLAGGEDKDYWTVQDLLIDQLGASQSPLALDANGVSILQNIATNDGLGAAEAQAWLALLGQPTVEEVILPGSTKQLRRNTAEVASEKQEEPMLSAYPNPSNGPVYMVYHVPEGVERTEILIHDGSGRLIRTENVAAKNGILELEAKALASGLHIASLYFDGIQVGTAKVEVIR